MYIKFSTYVKKNLESLTITLHTAKYVVRGILGADSDINAQSEGGKTDLKWGSLGTIGTPEVIITRLKTGADIEARKDIRITPLTILTESNPNFESLHS
jgi:hypothetical protein